MDFCRITCLVKHEENNQLRCFLIDAGKKFMVWWEVAMPAFAGDAEAGWRR